MPTRLDLEKIRKRIRYKRMRYVQYDFSRIQNDILKTFFDLAQEFDTLRDFYRICVAIPLEFLNVDSRLYLLDSVSQRLELICDSVSGLQPDRPPAPDHIRLVSQPYEWGESYVVPIYGKRPIARQLPVFEKDKIIGMLEIFPISRLIESDRFFLTKYTNRIGYNLHNRMIARQNIEHIKFINGLVRDIEHNVIVPNMYYKYLFSQMRKKITEMEEIETALRELSGDEGETGLVNREIVMDRVSLLRGQLGLLHEELQKHHSNISLFLESLFRRDHFEQGQLVLRPKKCVVGKEIVLPQLEHYGNRLRARGITVDHSQEMAVEEVALNVDVGLLSQVYANLVSNAVKYTEEIIDHRGQPRKAMSYGREKVPNFFGPGRDGIKFNVFTTGRHINQAEAIEIFGEGVRGSNSSLQPGTGHGLSFVKQVVEVHGGKVGYDPTEQGNNFYFILPLPTPSSVLE